MGGLSIYGDITDRMDRSGQRMRDWFDPASNWPPASLTGLNPVIDVEDLSMMLMRLDNGVFASYQQCHFTPDYWRNYTVIGTEGRLENFGDEAGALVRVWNRRSNFRADADITVRVPPAPGTHGGADRELVREFCAFVRDGAPTLTSPVAARDAVAAGYAATTSLREGGRCIAIDPVSPETSDYYAAGQPGTRPLVDGVDARIAEIS